MAKPGGKPDPKLVSARGGCSPDELAARRGSGPGGPPPPVCGIQQGPGRIRFGNYPLELFARSIGGRVGRAVVDQTGLSGNWEFELEFQPEVPPGQLPPGATPPPVDPDAPNFFTAIAGGGPAFPSTSPTLRRGPTLVVPPTEVRRRSRARESDHHSVLRQAAFQAQPVNTISDQIGLQPAPDATKGPVEVWVIDTAPRRRPTPAALEIYDVRHTELRRPERAARHAASAPSSTQSARRADADRGEAVV